MLSKAFTVWIFSNFLIASTIQIAVSANVSYAMADLKKEFNRLYPDIDIKTHL